VFPVDIFGPAVKGALDYMPFIYTIGFPIRTATGNLAVSDILNGMLIQCFWILVLAALSRVVWSAGSRKFSAAGG